MTEKFQQEMRAFNAYCLALQDLIDFRDHDGHDGITARLGLKCCYCGGKVPAGIPKQLAGKDRDACPACVFARDMHKEVQKELEALTDPLTDGERQQLMESAIAPPRRPSIRPREIGDVMRTGRGTKIARGIDATIDRLHNEMQNARTDDERTRLTRVIEAAERARDAGARRA